MSAVSNPAALAAIAVIGNAHPPNPPHPQNNPPNVHPPNVHPPNVHPPNARPKTAANCRPLPPHVDLEHLRFVERRARQEIKTIEENARIAAREQHPLEPLPRTESNVRSVKRTRQWRKEVERILKDKIIQKIERNRELDRLIEIEKEKSRRIKAEIAHVESLPDPEPHPALGSEQYPSPDLNQHLVQVDAVTPEQLMNDLVATMNTEDLLTNPQSPVDKQLPDQDFDQAFGDLANSLIDCQPFTDTVDERNDFLPNCEPTLNPKFLMGPHQPEEFDDRFLLDERDPML